MSGTLLEQIRSLHSDTERSIQKITDELLHKASTKKQSIHQDYRIQYHLKQIQGNASSLLVLHGDENESLQRELDEMGGSVGTTKSSNNNNRKKTQSGDLYNVIQHFEKKIRDVQLFYRDRGGGEASTAAGSLQERTEQRRLDLPFYERAALEQEQMEKNALMPSFTTEERYGKYVDLNSLYTEWLTVMGGIQSEASASEFLSRLGMDNTALENTGSGSGAPLRSSKSDTQNNTSKQNTEKKTTQDSSSSHSITDYFSFLKYFHLFHEIPHTKKTNDYLEYLKGLYNYFIDFFTRTQPLRDMDALLRTTEEKFNEDWQEGRLIGWESYLEQIGMTASKDGSKQNNASAGGNNAPPQKNSKPSQGKKKKRSRRGRKRKRPSMDLYREMALLEVKIQRLVEELSDEIEATQRFVEKKQTLTWEELQAEIERDEQMEDAIPEEEMRKQQKEKNEDTAQARKLLGGERELDMPLWLYKRRGLNIEYRCEICGNYSYWGPASFHRHFSGWRHQHGMKCLRIPNTKHFYGITSIKEALELWDKMQANKEQEEFNAEEQAEVEDEQGNVYDLKTFEDLKKQGLI